MSFMHVHNQHSVAHVEYLHIYIDMLKVQGHTHYLLQHILRGVILEQNLFRSTVMILTPSNVCMYEHIVKNNQLYVWTQATLMCNVECLHIYRH